MDSYEEGSRADLATIAIEHALLQMGTPELEKVKSRLKADYNITIGGCADHPEYLKQILCDLFGYCYQDILDDIKQVFKDIDMKCQMDEFYNVLRVK